MYLGMKCLDLQTRICNAFELVTTVEMLERTWREIEYRLDIVRATRGAHIANKTL